MRTLGQKRAEFALNKVVDIPQDKKDKFKPFSAGAPSMILQNGFGQASLSGLQRVRMNIVNT